MTGSPSGDPSARPAASSPPSGTSETSADSEIGAETPPRAIDSQDRPPERLVGFHRWLESRFSEQTRRRVGVVVGFGAAIVGTLIAMDLVSHLGLDIPWAAWLGLFLANWIGNGGILVPIPGLRFIGWTMAVHQGADGPTILVGLVAGLAMALGQTSFFLAAAAGSDLLSSSDKDRSGRLADTLRSAQDRIEDFVERHGFPTIFTLSVLPNPLTTFATITAASMGMGFRIFLVANFAGHVILGLILALFGLWLADG